MRHVHLRNNQYRGQEDRRDLGPERHAPAETVGHGSSHYSAESRARAEEDVDTALVQPAVGEGDEVGDDDGLASGSEHKSATAQGEGGHGKEQEQVQGVGSGRVGCSGKVVERRKHVSLAYVMTRLSICRPPSHPTHRDGQQPAAPSAGDTSRDEDEVHRRRDGAHERAGCDGQR